MKKELFLFCTSNYTNINNDLINNKYNLFDEVKLLTENDLDDYIKPIVENNRKKYGHDGNGWPDRGYGYWIWKPYLILQELNKLENDDILVHLDCHCKLDKLKDKFNDIKDYLYNSDKPLIIAKLGFNDYMYTTRKLANAVETYLNYKFSEEEMMLPQYEAGILFMKKNNFVVNFFKQYFEIMKNNIDAITDIYNNDINNHETFIDNRHDQSVCSLLAKYYKIDNYCLTWDLMH